MGEHSDNPGNCELLESLMRIWRSLDEDDRCELLDHARWLAGDSRLVGGPLDGLRLPERFKDSIHLSIEIGGRAAVYERDNNSMLRFDGFGRIGGEGGTWPDIRADELQALEGGSQ